MFEQIIAELKSAVFIAKCLSSPSFCVIDMAGKECMKEQ